MKRVLLVLLLALSISGCGPMIPSRDIQQAISLIRSASEDIRDHNVEPSRIRMGELIAQLEAEETRATRDEEKIKKIKVAIALEAENIEALKEFPEVLKDLELWSKGE